MWITGVLNEEAMINMNKCQFKNHVFVQQLLSSSKYLKLQVSRERGRKLDVSAI